MHSGSTRAHLGRSVAYHAWDRSQPPEVEIDPGDEVALSLRDGSNAQLDPSSTAETMLGLDPTQMDPLTGPIWVKGAEPGDVLTVEMLEISLASWGWSGIIPGLGLLHDKFPGPLFRQWDLTGSAVDIGNGMEFPMSPMVGVIGVAPAQAGRFSTVVPTEAGGNMDVKYIVAGSVVHLPVLCEGGLLSLGDAHALQGDGELNGTAIECEADIVIRVGLQKGGGLDAPVVDTAPHPVVQEPMRSFLGVGPDLFEASRDSALRATDALAAALRVDDADAYNLLGTIGELRIHEIVDRPNWVVGCMLPRRIFA
jgi:acetamidase/formamidase